MYATASYCTTISFNVISQAPVASGIESTIFDGPCWVCVSAGHATVMESGSVDDQLADTTIGPAPVKDCDALESSGSWRSPVQNWESTACCAGAVALDPLADGVTVVVVVTVVPDVTVLGGVTAVAGVVEVALTAGRVAVGTMSFEAAEGVPTVVDVVDVVDVVGIVSLP